MVEMKIASVGMLQGANGTIVVLREADGVRLLVIGVGMMEASAIAMVLEGVTPPRPMTHDLFTNIFHHVRFKLRRIVIDDLRDETFYAKLQVDTDDGSLEIDSRPSDAMALALRLDAPIYCSDKVLDEAAITDLDDATVH